MIDQSLIDENSATLVTALENSNKINNRLNLVESVFNDAILSKLQQYLDDNYHSENWIPETNEHGVPMHDVPRYKLTWDADTVTEELYEVCAAATPVLKKMYPNSFQTFNGIVIWRDHPGYFIDWHTDNPVIGVSLQIYLDSDTDIPGTEFLVDSGSLLVPFSKNTGYVVDHSGPNKPSHRIAHPVPANALRYSLFALWYNSH